MVRYYMQLRDGTEHLLDPEGIEYADIDELKKKVLIAVRDQFGHSSVFAAQAYVRNGWKADTRQDC
ncbi:DUF6894 family protein [Sphingomonas sp. URHD0057]|uniref:DUF6894 family protein n=1 Tax=Sphingomonas sp. URHD0057 TaxID=1380389 RepID=UPI00048DB892|nr:hypothetical protein [Sphingomonas sp. URHD0057]